MAKKATRVSTSIDFESTGKSTGYLSVPYTRNDSGGGNLMVPIACIRNGTGPTILFTGGNHGDEYEGPVALLKLIRSLKSETIQGRIVVMPALNLPALLAGNRVSPIDWKNMNRVFPGHRNGTVTEVVAHYVTTQILPMVDAVYDLHAGGKSSWLIPSVMMHYLEDPLMGRTLAALKAFKAPASVIIEEVDTDGMFDVTVENMDKIFICAELGGAGTLSPETMHVTETGISNVLKHFGLIEGKPAASGWSRWKDSRTFEVPGGECYSVAMAEGIYEPIAELGDTVEAGQALGQVHFPDAPERDPMQVKACTSGIVFCRHAAGQVYKRDNVAVIAHPSDR